MRRGEERSGAAVRRVVMLNVCLLSHSDRDQIYIGDDNALTLEVSAENQGEGAYEAELLVYPPEQADFTGVVRSQVWFP